MTDVTSDIKKQTKMDPELKAKVDNFTPFCKKYCEYRAKGLSQGDSSLKAGSESKDKAVAGRVGYHLEQQDGVKDYINYLIERRATFAMVESTELVDKLRDVYEEAMEKGRFQDANKAVELLGNMIGAFNNGKNQGGSDSQKEDNKKTKNNTAVFKDSEETQQEKMDKIAKLIKSEKGKMEE